MGRLITNGLITYVLRGKLTWHVKTIEISLSVLFPTQPNKQVVVRLGNQMYR